MSISRALGAEKPATKRPRSYGEVPRSGKTNCKKVEENVYGRMLPVAASPKKGGGARARARAPPSSRCPLRVRDSFYRFIYLYLLTYPYLSLSLSLSLFEQVKLLERA